MKIKYRSVLPPVEFKRYYCPNCRKKRFFVNNAFCEACGYENKGKKENGIK